MTQTEESTQLMVAGVRRGFASAVKFVTKALVNRGGGAGWKSYITHGGVKHMAEQAHKIVSEAIPDASYEIMPLSPAFITQGGPGCVAIQIVRM